MWVYALTEDRSELRFSHQLKFENELSNLNEKHLGSITSMKWSTDGCAIAVGWNSGMVAIWSTYGQLLSHILPENMFK